MEDVVHKAKEEHSKEWAPEHYTHKEEYIPKHKEAVTHKQLLKAIEDVKQHTENVMSENISSHPVLMGGGTDGFGGLGGGGLLGGLLLGALLRNNGGLFGGGNGGGVEELTDVSILSKLGELQKDVATSQCGTQAAIAAASADTNQQILQQTIDLGQQSNMLNISMLNGFNNVTREVGAVGAGITSAVVNEGEKTRALISAIDRENLNRIITSQASELAELRNENRHEAAMSSIKVEMINNQSQNQLQAQQQNAILGQFATVLAGIDQNIRSQNTAINVGGTQLASPTNTNTQIR